MGTWSTSISGNDTYADVYDDIVRRFNDGEEIEKILDSVIKQYSKDLDDEPCELHSLYFAAAKAGWERGCLPGKLFEKVKFIIDGGDDIKAWRELGASESDIRKREKVLQDFLAKISVPCEKPKKAKKVILRPAVFRKGDIFSILKDDGTYGGAVVMEEYGGEYGSNLIVEADMCWNEAPMPEDVLAAPVYSLSDYACYQFKKYKDRFNVLGKAQIPHTFNEFTQSASSWITLLGPHYENVRMQCLRAYKNISTFIKINARQLDELVIKMRKEILQDSLRRGKQREYPGKMNPDS